MKEDFSLIIKKLDAGSLKQYIRKGGELSLPSVNIAIEQLCNIDEDIFWDDEDTTENGFDLIKELDERKSAFVDILLDNGVCMDDESLLLCYSYRCPDTARVLLEYGANPNVDWGGGESCIGMCIGGLEYNIRMNQASRPLIEKYKSTLYEFGGIYLNFLFVSVFYDSWQMRCCGEPFHIGDTIELYVEKCCDKSKGNCSFYENHHYSENRQYILKGIVKEINAKIVQHPYNSNDTCNDTENQSTYMQVSYADGYSEVPNNCEILGYAITLTDYTVENIRPTMDIFIGLQASGKTSYSNREDYANYEHINLDTLKTRGREKRRLIESMRARKNIVIDNTNPSIKERKRYINEAKKYGYDVVCHFFQSRLKECIERNAPRENTVPVAGLVDASRRMELPTKDEGFSEMFFVRIKDGKFEESKWIEDN